MSKTAATVEPVTLGEQVVTPAPEAVPASDAAQAFTFGSEAFRPMSALPALDRLSERMARRVREVIGPFARVKPRVAAEPVAIRRFESWLADQPEFTSLSIYRFRPLKGAVLIAIEPHFISRLVDAFYGGSGENMTGRLDEFTPTEEQLVARVSDAIMGTMTEVWSEVMAVQSQLTSRETNTAYASLVRREDPVAVARFTVTPLEGPPTVIDILYPVASLRAVEQELSAKVIDDAGSVGGEWRDRLMAAIGEVRLDARSVLARPTLTLAELLKLAPGDVIPVSLPPMVPLLVAGRMLAQGVIGDHDGRAALKIEKMAHRSPGK